MLLHEHNEVVKIAAEGQDAFLAFVEMMRKRRERPLSVVGSMVRKWIGSQQRNSRRSR